MREGTSRRLCYNIIYWRYLKFNLNDYIANLKDKNLIKQKVSNIFQKLFQLMKQERHGCQINF